MKLEEPALDANEAADVLGVHVETIRRMARKGSLPSFKMGKDWRFSLSELRRWAAEHHLRARRSTILIVDDDRAVAEALTEHIQSKGLKVLVAANGAEALRILRRETVSLVFLDLVMPEMDGPQCLRLLRQEHPGLPVALLTGMPDKDLLMRAAEHGPCMLVMKPVDLTHLDEAIRLALAHHIPGRS